MAKGKNPKGKPFESGKSGNTPGRPKLDYNSIEARAFTRSQVLNAMNDVMSRPSSDLADLGNPKLTPYTPGALALMAAILDKAIFLGCPQRAQFFMSYLFGRPSEYDPKEDSSPIDPKESLNNIPSAVMIRALHEHKKATEGQSAS